MFVCLSVGHTAPTAGRASGAAAAAADGAAAA